MKLKYLSINGARTSLEKLVIIVGPNGVGKTTFLRNLHSQFVNSKLLDISQDPSFKWPNLLPENFLETTLSEWQEWTRALVEVGGGNVESQQAFALSEYLSHDDRDKYLSATQKHNLLNRLLAPTTPEELDTIAGPQFRAQNSILLDVDRRFFISNNAAGNFTNKNAHDLRPAAFLATHPDTLKRINTVLKQLFNKALYVEPHNNPSYTIDVGAKNTPTPPILRATTQGIIRSKELYARWFQDNQISSLSSEGHGIRAAVEILYALENSSKKILFIDEPELHLYPAAKYSIGKIIGQYSNSQKQVILCTHDSDMLRGLIHGSRNSTVVRINSNRTISISSGRNVSKTYGNEILQSAFQDGVVLVEGIADEYVYGNALSLKHLLDGFSCQVIPSHGADRIYEGLPFTLSLGIKTAVVVDYDVIFKPSRNNHALLIKIMQEKRCQQDTIARADELVNDIKAFSAGLQNKKKGLEATGLNTARKRTINQLIGLVKIEGIFIVPCGYLENWVGLPEDAPAEKVLGRYRNFSNTKYRALTNFLREIACYVKA